MKAEGVKRIYYFLADCNSGDAVELYLEGVWFMPLPGHLPVSANIYRGFMHFLLSNNRTVLLLGQIDFYVSLS